jgi:hypothetical protein
VSTYPTIIKYLDRFDSAKSFINALVDKQRIEIFEEHNNSKWSQSFEKKKGGRVGASGADSRAW